MRMAFRDATIIGTGALGSSLCRAMHPARLTVKSLFNRTPSRAGNLADDLEIAVSGNFPEHAGQLGEVIFLTVPDRQIKPVANALAGIDGELAGSTVVHCSGNEDSGLLQPVSEKGAIVASFHPLQTFSGADESGLFEGIYIDMEGDPGAIEKLKQLARSLGAHPLELDASDKPHLHAAAVTASNYLVALLDAASEIGSAGELSGEVVRRSLMPLVATTLENISDKPLADALTGPIARGDVDTVRKQIALLNHNERLCSLYKRLGHQALKLAHRKGYLTRAQEEELSRLLDS